MPEPLVAANPQDVGRGVLDGIFLFLLPLPVLVFCWLFRLTPSYPPLVAGLQFVMVVLPMLAAFLSMKRRLVFCDSAETPLTEQTFRSTLGSEKIVVALVALAIFFAGLRLYFTYGLDPRLVVILTFITGLAATVVLERVRGVNKIPRAKVTVERPEKVAREGPDPDRAEESAGPCPEPIDAEVIAPSPGSPPPDRPGMDHEPVPKLISWPAVVILCLGPFVFLPFFRQTFPHYGLWPAALTIVAGIYLLQHGISRWDRLVAGVGLLFAVLAFIAFQVGLMAEKIPGPRPEFREPAAAPFAAWVYSVIEIAVLLFSVILHECAHGIAAYLSGDPTAKRQGRISLNPLRHIDLFGSVFLPLLLILSRAGTVFGWAKPVPVDPARFRHARRGRLAVSLAGVMTNLGLAVFCGSALQVLGILLHLRYPGLVSKGFAIPGARVLFSGLPDPAFWQILAEILKAGIIINMVLFILNILPLPPLDGYGVVEGLMSERIRAFLQKARPYGAVLFFILIMTRAIDYALWPGLISATVLTVIAGAAAKLG
ncbi:MAG: site-2 protease family protein [Firmicutes bacterium]|nr:site-2 protease family protein [Bacillota bacterium]